MTMTNNEELVVMSQNLRSLTTGFDKLRTTLDMTQYEDKFDVICCQETFKIEGNYLLSGYEKPHHIQRKTKRGGGVITWTKRGLTAKEDQSFSIMEEGHYESIATTIETTKGRTTIINFYRPPSGKIDKFMSALKAQLHLGHQEQRKMIFIGDANINWKTEGRTKDNLEQLLLANGKQQAVKVVTRPGKSQSIIDHCYLPLECRARVEVLSLLISDHNAITLKMYDTKTKLRLTKPRVTFVHSQENIDYLRQRLKREDWNTKMEQENPDRNAKLLQDLLRTLIEECSKETKMRKEERIPLPKWLLNLRSRVRGKLTAWQKERGNTKKEESYKLLNRRYRKELKKFQDQTTLASLSNKDPRELWRQIKKATHQTREEQSTIELTGVAAHDTPEQFVEYYAGIAEKIHSQLEQAKIDPITLTRGQSRKGIKFQIREVTQAEVGRIMKNLTPKRSSGHDQISSKLVKSLAQELTKPMTMIINQMIRTRKFPQCWKIAKVIPLYKNKGEPTKIENYRPISLLPALSKIAEKVLSKQIYAYFELFNIFPRNQFGFRSGRSTEQAVIQLITEIELAKKTKTDIALLLLDFSKAFDLISHDILCKKLLQYGFTEQATEIVSAYLRNRQMSVHVNGKNSTPRTMNSAGCPQGSVLGPLLYLIYTADIPQAVENLTDTVTIFADDTSLIIKNPTEMKISQALTAMETYSTANRLKLNMTKTEVTTNKDIANITIGNNKITVHPPSHSLRYLGVYLNINLTWEKQIKEITRKAMSAISLMYKIRSAAPPQVLKLLYEALVKSHLQYSLAAWGPQITQDQQKTLDKIQCHAIKCISNIKGPMHFSDSRRNMKILKQADLTTLSTVSHLLTLAENPANPLRDYYRVNKARTRLHGNLQAVKPTRGLMHAEKIANQYQVLWTQRPMKPTKLRNIKEAMALEYKTKCDRKDCYTCNNMRRQRQLPLILD